MPFGIPPITDARASAAGDYASAAQQESAELIALIVGPISEQIEAIERAVDMYAKAIGKAVKKHSGGIGREVDDINSTITEMVGYVAQETAQYVAQLTALAVAPTHGAGAKEAPAEDSVPDPYQSDVSTPPPPPPPPPVADEPAVCFSVPQSPPPSPPPPPLQPPQLATTFPCPSTPAEWGTGFGIIGSEDWCHDVAKLLDWLDTLGTQLADWVKQNVQPSTWSQKLSSLVAADSDSDFIKALQLDIKRVLQWIGGTAANVINTVSDMIRCAVYYTQVFTPVSKPGAYIALLFLRNVITWIRGSRVGTQTYGGFTIALSLTLPQLERQIDHLLHYLCPVEIPTYPEVVEAYIRGYVSNEQLDCLLRLNGLDPGLYTPFIEARGEQLSVRDAIQFARRTGATDKHQRDLLRRAGVLDSSTANRLDTLYDELPSVQDHLNWLRKGIFIPGYVDKYQLDSGFQEFYSGDVKRDLHSQGYTEYRAKKEYEAHWIQPSPGELREFVYRLRADKVAPDLARLIPADGNIPDDLANRLRDRGVFLVSDYERILVEQEYAPLARKWFAETVYNVPALGYLRDMYRSGVINNEELKGYHRDLGYNETDSTRFVSLDAALKARQNARMGSGWSPAALRRAVSVHAITPDVVHQNMQEQGFPDVVVAQLLQRADSDFQYRVLTRSLSTQLTKSIGIVQRSQSAGIMSTADAAGALAKLGIPADRAKGIADLNAADARVSRIKGAVVRIKKAFTSGEIDAAYARQSLLSLKLCDGAIDDYLAVWVIEMTPRRKRLTASQIVEELSLGQIDTAEAHIRLTNLGYDDADQSLLIADAARATVTTPEALAQLALEPSGKAGPALARLGDELIGLSKKIVAQLKAQEPPAKLGKWLKNGIVDAGYVRHRLHLYGWDDSSIDKWVQEYGPEEEEEAPPPPGE